MGCAAYEADTAPLAALAAIRRKSTRPGGPIHRTPFRSTTTMTETAAFEALRASPLATELTEAQ